MKTIFATAIVKERCEKMNLSYTNPEYINMDDYDSKEDEGILDVHHVLETLYRLSNGFTPAITNV